VNKRLPLFIALLFLCPSKASTGQSYILTKGDTLSEVLWRFGYSPLYGKDAYLEKALKLNELDLDSAKKLFPGTKLILPVPPWGGKGRPSAISPPLSQEFSFILGLENRYLNYKDQNGNKAGLEVPLRLRLGLGYNKSVSENLKLRASVFYDYYKYRPPGGANLSEDNFSSFGFEAGALLLKVPWELALAYGRELWATPISTSGERIVMGSQSSSYILPAASYQLRHAKLKVYAKSYLPREGKDFEIRPSNLYGSEIIFPPGDNQLGIYYEAGERNTDKLTEELSSFGLRIYIKKGP